MSAAGHIFSMIQRMKENREALNARRCRTDKIKESFNADHETRRIKDKKVSPEKLEKIKNGIQKDAASQKRKSIIVAVIS